MADGKRKHSKKTSKRHERRTPESYVARPSEELADELKHTDDPAASDTATGRAFAVSEREDVTTVRADDTDFSSDSDDEWDEGADAEAMAALDEEIVAAQHQDIEASMEEDIAGEAEGVSRRNPQLIVEAANPDWSTLPLRIGSRRAEDQEVASFLKYTGGTFPSLFRSDSDSATQNPPPETSPNEEEHDPDGAVE
jgi:hypothetical protein